jgi:hypothetical protein
MGGFQSPLALHESPYLRDKIELIKQALAACARSFVMLIKHMAFSVILK